MTTSWSGERRSFPPKIAKQILARAHHRCEIRGPNCTGRATEADHVIPVAEGGTDDPSNGQAACSTCHAEKTAREQARGRARRSPRRKPARHPSEVKRARRR